VKIRNKRLNFRDNAGQVDLFPSALASSRRRFP